ncbi:TetR/AcrR family transcriptional regulator [Methanobrevibacter sp.]|uniref:TetR/AcrR family transcriptional regulator n=1 Tax=Methanobrevibacter sp. TaxID=66852 RepID=UPI00388D68FA
MRVVKDPEVRKKEILTGAIQVFTKKGYDKTTINDIAKELGISQGLCYRYYASKEEIYDTALEDYSDFIVNSNLQRFKNDERTFKEKIRDFSGHMQEYQNPESDKELLYELFHGQNSKKMHDQLMMKTASKLVPHIKNELQIAKDNGEIQISDVDAFAYFFVYGQVGMLLNQTPSKECDVRIQDLLMELLQL